MFGQSPSTFDRNQLRAIMQAQASRAMAAASDQAVVKEMAVETLLDPSFVTPIGISITPDGDGGVIFEVPSGGGGGSLVTVRGEVPVGAINGSNMVYSIAFAPLAGVSFFYNGLRLGEDQFSLVSQVLTLNFAPETGASLRVDYEHGSVSGATRVRGEVPVGAINGSNMVFALAHAPVAGVSLYHNGSRLVDTLYGLSGTALTLSFAPEIGASFRVDYEF